MPEFLKNLTVIQLLSSLWKKNRHFTFWQTKSKKMAKEVSKDYIYSHKINSNQDYSII